MLWRKANFAILNKKEGDFVCEICEKPTKEYGRCSNPSCWHKLYPDGHKITIINVSDLQDKIYPTLSRQDY